MKPFTFNPNRYNTNFEEVKKVCGTVYRNITVNKNGTITVRFNRKTYQSSIIHFFLMLGDHKKQPINIVCGQFSPLQRGSTTSTRGEGVNQQPESSNQNPATTRKVPHTRTIIKHTILPEIRRWAIILAIIAFIVYFVTLLI